MARKKSKTRIVYRKAKASYRRNKTSYGLLGQAMAAFGYGTAREKISSMVDPFTRKLGLGVYADEAGMAMLSFVAAKYTTGIPKKIGKAGLQIEMARLGSKMNLLGGLGLGSKPAEAKSNGLLF